MGWTLSAIILKLALHYQSEWYSDRPTIGILIDGVRSILMDWWMERRISKYFIIWASITGSVFVGGGGGATDTMNDRLVATISLFTVLLKAMKE